MNRHSTQYIFAHDLLTGEFFDNCEALFIGCTVDNDESDR
jgi:hypothetical protein